MPGIDKDCEGDGATHHLACKCREAYFSKVEKRLKDATVRLYLCVSHLWDVKMDKHSREIVKEGRRFLEGMGYDDSDFECDEQAMH